VSVLPTQAEAERRKRAHILDSEAEQMADINIAEGRKRSQVIAKLTREFLRTNLATLAVYGTKSVG